VLDTLATRPSMSWVRSLTPVELGEKHLRLIPAQGHREVMGFLTDARKEQISQVVESVLGRRVRVEVTTSTAGPSDETGDSGAGSGAQEPDRPTPANQRREAFSLPLVKHVVDLFDVTLTDVRPESEQEQEQETEQETEDV